MVSKRNIEQRFPDSSRVDIDRRDALPREKTQRIGVHGEISTWPNISRQQRFRVLRTWWKLYVSASNARVNPLTPVQISSFFYRGGFHVCRFLLPIDVSVGYRIWELVSLVAAYSSSRRA